MVTVNMWTIRNADYGSAKMLRNPLVSNVVIALIFLSLIPCVGYACSEPQNSNVHTQLVKSSEPSWSDANRLDPNTDDGSKKPRRTDPVYLDTGVLWVVPSFGFVVFAMVRSAVYQHKLMGYLREKHTDKWK